MQKNNELEFSTTCCVFIPPAPKLFETVCSKLWGTRETIPWLLDLRALLRAREKFNNTDIQYYTFPYFSLLSSHSTKFYKRGTVQILAKGWFLKWAKGDNNKVLLRVEVVLCNCWEHSHCVQIRFLSLFFEPYKVSCLPLSSYNCLV